MIDLHCHLLPGIDDGPRTVEQSLEIARLAVASGTRHIVATPHIRPGIFDNDLDGIREAHGSFVQALAEHDIPLSLGMAAEVHICPEILPLAKSGRLPFLGELDGSPVLLLEFPHERIMPGSDKLVNWLLSEGIRPMIPHPERNREVMADPDKMAPFVDWGCLLQVTAGSVAGDFGPDAREVATIFLERGWVTALASDAHNVNRRSPDLSRGRDAAADIVGETDAWSLVRAAPLSIAGPVADLAA